MNLRKWLDELDKRQVIRALSDRDYAGKFGERKAAGFLRKKCGFKVLARNWRHGKGELDIVCRDGDVLVFVEVRARRDTALVQGYHSIGYYKKKTLLACCKAYIYKLKQRPGHFRFDVVQLALSTKGTYVLHHYKNTLLFSKDFRF